MEKDKLYMELQEIDHQVKQLNAHIEQIDEQLEELKVSVSIVSKVGQMEEEDVRIPIASGIYCKGHIENDGKLLVNVGAGVMVEKSPDEVISILNDQSKEITQYRETMVQNMRSLISKVEEIQKNV